MTSKYTDSMMAAPMAADVPYLVRRVEERDERICKAQAELRLAMSQLAAMPLANRDTRWYYARNYIIDAQHALEGAGS